MSVLWRTLNRQHYFSVRLHLLRGRVQRLLIQMWILVWLHGTGTGSILSAVPVKLVQNQVFRFQNGRFLKFWVTGTNQVKEQRLLRGRLCRQMVSTVLCIFMSVLCINLHIASYLMQYETCHSPVVCNGLCGPINCFQCNMAMRAYSATCWLDTEHTMPITVYVPLVDGLGWRRINQIHRLFDCFALLNTAKVEHRGRQGNIGT